MAVVRRQYSMQRFLNNWSVLCTATEAHFGKGTKGDTALPTLPNPHYPSKIANTLATLVKGEVLSPKKFGRLPEELPHQPSPRTNPSKNRTIPLAFRRGASLLLPLHRIQPFPQQLQKDNNPSKIANTLASLVTKGGGLTARHKLLLCCVLIATHPPFLSPNLSAVKTEGLSH